MSIDLSKNKFTRAAKRLLSTWSMYWQPRPSYSELLGVKPTLILVLLITQLIQVAVGQQSQNPPPSQPTQNPPPIQEPKTVDAQDVVKITTNLVQIDAVITDKNGKRVIDLKPDEVELYEDGNARSVTNFSYINLNSSNSSPVSRPSNTREAGPPPLVSRQLRPQQVRRTIALVVDDLGLSFESSVHVRNSLRKFLDEQLQPDDLIAIIRTSGGIGALQSFTTDRRQLYAAVEKVKWNLIGRAEVSGSFMSTAGMLRRENPRQGISSVEDMDAEKHLRQMRRDMFTVGTLGALHYVIKGLQPLPGRKSVVLFSEGFKIPRGADFYENERILETIRELTDFANRAAVVLYTIDARGLQTLGLSAGDATTDFNSEQVIAQLAERSNSLIDTQQGLAFLSVGTGGLAIRNTNDLNKGIKEILEDQQGYYLIGYRPDDSTFVTVNGKSKFHHIKLKVKREGNYSVRTRNSFYGRTDEGESARLTPKEKLEDALTSPFTSSDIQVKLTSIFANNKERGSMLQSFLHIKATDLTFTTETDGSHKTSFAIAAVTFGDNGKLLDQFGYPVNITVPASDFERINRNGFVYSLAVPVKTPGAYQLRMAIRDEASERIGSAMQFVEVPDLNKNRLTVSGILLSGISLSQYLKGSSVQSGEKLEGANLTVDADANPAVRRFKGELALVYAFNVYNAHLDKKTGKAHLKTQLKLYRDEKLVFTGDELEFSPLDATDPKRLLGAGVVQIKAGMPAGAYVIQIVVTDLLEKGKAKIASQWIDFDIAN